MLRVVVACLALAAPGCYDPSYQEGIACGPGGECPDGLICAVDSTCRRTAGAGGLDSGARADASPVRDSGGTISDAGPPDAAPVECEADEDCQTPPATCLLPGTCDLDSQTCRFAAVDCSGLDGECTQGACEPATGECVAQPINQDQSCGAGTVCEPFGPCTPEGDVCDETGVQSRNCTVNTCQGGACVAGSETENAACSLGDTDGNNCGGPTVSDCGACNYTSACDEVASQTCTCTTFSCAGGTCTSSSTSCTQQCTRDTDGDFCPFDGVCQDGICIQNPCPLCVDDAGGAGDAPAATGDSPAGRG